MKRLIGMIRLTEDCAAIDHHGGASSPLPVDHIPTARATTLSQRQIIRKRKTGGLAPAVVYCPKITHKTPVETGSYTYPMLGLYQKARIRTIRAFAFSPKLDGVNYSAFSTRTTFV
ncbi:hypothetical protein [Spirosoma jeollabukense]